MANYICLLGKFFERPASEFEHLDIERISQELIVHNTQGVTSGHSIESGLVDLIIYRGIPFIDSTRKKGG